MNEKDKQRFLSNYIPEPNSGCWLWSSYCGSTGYGRFSSNNKMFWSHRVSWEIHKGKIPKGLCVLHKCDIPSCINPDHLFLGTQAENVKDCVKKGRHKFGLMRGENQVNSKLTEKDILEIRKSSLTQTEIAKIYKIKQATVSGIKLRKSWKHI